MELERLRMLPVQMEVVCRGLRKAKDLWAAYNPWLLK